MRRKIACILTAVITVIFMVLRVIDYIYPTVMIGSVALPDCLIAIALIIITAIVALCFTKSDSVNRSIPAASTLGWLATFCGAMLVMSIVLDTFCWAFYNQIPPPNDHILNNVDYYSLVFSLLFGIVSGVFLILQGFNWMAGIRRNHAYLNWMTLAPILWMWFRLARYEISYASTIDITHSFFDFASLVTASLFFLELARSIAKIGEPSKNGMIISSLIAGVCSLSGAPLTFYKLAHGETIHVLLISIVDATIGLLALSIAFYQTFSKQIKTETDNIQDDAMAWNDPIKERQPLDPPFAIDEKLPFIDSDDTTEAIDEISENHIENVSEAPVKKNDVSEMSVDDILAELNKTNSI